MRKDNVTRRPLQRQAEPVIAEHRLARGITPQSVNSHSCAVIQQPPQRNLFRLGKFILRKFSRPKLEVAVFIERELALVHQM